MRRREFVRGIVTVPFAAKAAFAQQQSGEVPVAAPQSAAKPALPPAGATAPASPLRKGLLEFDGSVITSSVPDVVAETEAHFLTHVQFATLHRLCEVFMPPLNGYPGAIQAGAPEFIDFLLSVSPVDRQEFYRYGLQRLNTDAEKHFGIPFARVDTTQAGTLLHPWLRTWMPDHPPQERYARFINIAHEDIRTATMNSQPWSIAATSMGDREPGVGLYWSPIDPDIQRYV